MPGIARSAGAPPPASRLPIRSPSPPSGGIDGVDGIDGIEDNAGAIVGPDTLARAAALGMKAAAFLDRNDAYGFFEPLGDLVLPGPTFTNVNDFRALLVL